MPWTISHIFATLPPRSWSAGQACSQLVLICFLTVFQRVVIMVVRIAQILSAGVLLVLLADVRPAAGDGWSLPKPFASSDTTTDAKAKKLGSKTPPKQPSTWDKVTTGTKNLFTKPAETLGLKKPEPKKQVTGYAYPTPPKIQPPKPKSDSKSWVPSWLQPEKPKQPKDVKEFLQQPRLDL
jgi:hypothetical protein